MKHFRLLVPAILAILALLVSSCASQKRAWYLQDANPFTPEQIAESGQIRIKPLDRLTIVVNSKDPELAVPFNSSTSLSSVTGVASYSSATNQSLQIRTVDENGMLDMPVIGKIDCKGKPGAANWSAAHRRQDRRGRISTTRRSTQFADMKISVVGEVARPGQYDVTRDKISIFDALAMAGDLTIYGIRTDVAVAREVDGVRTIEYLDLTSKDLFNSPAFYIQLNDVIYVKPNKYKAQAGEISQNRNFYLSLVSTASR